jgi:D-hydroxyproline dehydrogenase subunit gamma
VQKKPGLVKLKSIFEVVETVPDPTAFRLPVVQSGARVVFSVDGRPVSAHDGEMLAAALMAAGIVKLRQSPNRAPRGAFCLMGACQECLVRIDGRTRQACLTTVTDGMVVEFFS